MFFFEKLSDTHRFDRLPCRMREEEGQAVLGQSRNAELRGDVHKPFNVIPGNGTIKAEV